MYRGKIISLGCWSVCLVIGAALFTQSVSAEHSEKGRGTNPRQAKKRRRSEEKLGPLQLELIRSYTHKLESENPCDLEAPYTVQYKKAGAALSFVAADHGKATLDVVTREFDRLKPTVVIVEGMWMGNTTQEKINARADECKMRKDCSESLFTVNLARDNKVPYVVGEPSAIELREALIKAGYDKKDILARFLLGEWHSGVAKKESLDAWFERKSKLVKATYGLETIEFGLADLRAWYKEHVTREPLEKYDGSMAPKESPQNRLEKMWTAANRVRNESLMRKIDAEVRKPGARVLAVYGSGHWLETSPAIEKIFGRQSGVVDSAGNVPNCK